MYKYKVAKGYVLVVILLLIMAMTLLAVQLLETNLLEKKLAGAYTRYLQKRLQQRGR